MLFFGSTRSVLLGWQKDVVRLHKNDEFQNVDKKLVKIYKKCIRWETK